MRRDPELRGPEAFLDNLLRWGPTRVALWLFLYAAPVAAVCLLVFWVTSSTGCGPPPMDGRCYEEPYPGQKPDARPIYAPQCLTTTTSRP